MTQKLIKVDILFDIKIIKSWYFILNEIWTFDARRQFHNVRFYFMKFQYEIIRYL